MSGQMVFGTLYDTSGPGVSTATTLAKMSVIPAPDPGMTASSTGYFQTIELENGGSDVVTSDGKRRTYSMSWNLREGSGANGLDLIRHYQQGLYGKGLIYFADPMNYSTNLFTPQFAAPMLIGQGWKSVLPEGTISYPNTLASYQSTYNLPMKSVTQVANSGLKGKIQTIPVMPGYALWAFFRSGETTTQWSGSLYARPIKLDGTFDTVQTMQVNGTGSTQYSFSSATYKAVQFYVEGTLPFAWASSIAQMWPIGTTPNLAGTPWVPGAGNNGCKINTDAIVENYSMVDAVGGTKHYKGMSIELTETGPWNGSA